MPSGEWHTRPGIYGKANKKSGAARLPISLTLSLTLIFDICEKRLSGLEWGPQTFLSPSSSIRTHTRLTVHSLSRQTCNPHAFKPEPHPIPLFLPGFFKKIWISWTRAPRSGMWFSVITPDTSVCSTHLSHVSHASRCLFVFVWEPELH